MQNLKQKNTKINRLFLAKLLICQQFLSIFEKNNRLVHKKRLNLWFNKRHLRADGFPLLPSALRPRLLGLQRSSITSENQCLNQQAKIANRDSFSPNAAKIVVMTTILSVFGLFSLNSATPVSAASLTLSIPTDALKLDLQANNVFAKSSPDSISVKTDASGGYTLSIKAKNNNNLVNGNNKIPSITSSLAEDQYKADGNTNTWGYQPSKFSSSDNTAFLPGPTTSPSTIEKTSAKNDAENSYNFVIGAKVDSSTPVGPYSNTFIITATANANIYTYSITYNLNGGNPGSAPNPNPQTGETEEQSIKLSETKPTRDGYEFIGWCTANPTNNSTFEPVCSDGQVYTEGQDYILSDDSNIINLYAMWQQQKNITIKDGLLTSVVKVDAGVTSLNFKVGENIEMVMVAEQNSGGTNYYKPHYAFAEADITGLSTAEGNTLVITVVPKAGYKLDSWNIVSARTQTWTATGVSGTYTAMKDVTKEECLAAGVDGMNVTDERNNVSYTIGNFNSKCFMYSNLRLEPETVLDPTTSDVSDEFIVPSSNSNSWTANWAKKTMIACRGKVGYTGSSSIIDNCNENVYGVTEYYYNWYAAKANPYEGSGSNDATPTNDAKSLGSICPKNWRLLLDESEMSALANFWNSDKANNPGRLVTSGYNKGAYDNWSSGQHSGVGSGGSWWSSTRVTSKSNILPNAYVYYFSMSGSGAKSTNYEKRDGHSVRCIIR